MTPKPIKEWLLADWVQKQTEKEDLIQWARSKEKRQLIPWEQLIKEYRTQERSRMIVFIKSLIP